MQTIHASFNTFTLLCYACTFPRRLMVMSCHRPASDPNRIFKTDVNPNSRYVINEIVNINGNLFLRMPFNCTRTHFSQSSIKGIANSREMKVLRESRNLTYSMSMAQDLCPFIFSPLAFITGIIPFAGHKFCMWADHGENYPSVFQAIWLGLSPFTFRWYLCHRRGNALLLHLDHAQMASESLMSLHLIATT